MHIYLKLCIVCTLQREANILSALFFSQVLDVKNSWRKALEEDKAKKTKAMELNGSLPVGFSQTQSDICPITPTVATQDSPSVCQQGVMFKSALSWDTFNTETIDSPSGTGSSAIQFSLDQEILPEIPSCDSLQLDDEAVDLNSGEDQESFILSLKTESKSPVAPSHGAQVQQARNEDSLLESARTSDCLVSSYKVIGLDREWLTEPAASVENAEVVFSLDLDALEAPSTPKKQEYILPELITFSPIDDMKC